MPNDSIKALSSSVKYTLKEMGYDEKQYATEYVIKLHDLIIDSSANYRDRKRMLRNLQHLIHKLPNKRIKK